MKRREFLKATLTSAPVIAVPSTISAAAASARTDFRLRPFEWEEATLEQLQSAMKAGKTSAVSLAKAYLRRIEELDRSGPAINSIIELNPDALAIARELDRERKSKGARGPLHGIPVVIKDNIDTHDRMMTTAGSLALLGSIPEQDAFVVHRLRAAGAVILGKTNLSEWANFRSTRSTSGWSGRGGLTRNPYVLDRNPCGSSSGTGAAVSANFCAVGVGTETNGSIICPSSFNGLVGLKPTVGLVSRAGIIPIAHSQDIAGPMTRTVTDAAILLGVLAGEDPRDATTRGAPGKAQSDYTRFLDPNGLRGLRLGVARQFFKLHPGAQAIATAALDVLENCGAILIDPINIPSHGKYGDSQDLVLHYEFKAGLNAYLAGLGRQAPVKNLEELIAFNQRNRAREMPYFEQEIFLKAQECGPLTDNAYLEALARNRRMSRAEGIDAAMDEHRLDAIVAPTTGPAHVTDLVHGDRWLGACTTPAAVAGYPHITVPAGDVLGLPVGLSFFTRAFGEPTLLRCAYAFERATKARKAPRFIPTLRETGPDSTSTTM